MIIQNNYNDTVLQHKVLVDQGEDTIPFILNIPGVPKPLVLWSLGDADGGEGCD